LTAEHKPLFSLLLPTRNRVKDLTALLQSLEATTLNPGQLEIILGIDEDDQATRAFTWEGLTVKKTILTPGLTMGAMNNACYAASTGRYVMLMNDDMLVRTQGWDDILEKALAPIRDDIFLAHVNDLLFGEKLCCFPMLSRTLCDMAGGVCPSYYERYRIDDHIYNVFNLLAMAGHRRIYYFPDVVFEHLNFEAMDSGNREYLYDKPTLERDAHRFDERLEERKSLALAMADHIESFRMGEVRDARSKVLGTITNSQSCRRPEHPRRVSTKEAGAAGGSGKRVTIGVVCSDIRRTFTQTCISLIKAHTSNYELVVLDNANDPNFNHAREMNRLLEFSRNEQVVLLDDDVYVEPGWLEDMQSALTGTVGCVTPLHKDGTGHLSYAGVYVGLDDNGDHAHLMEVAEHPILVPTLCSAAMLIDMNRCGHLRFDEGCLKYFHDLDYGLQVWEAGSQVACNTKVPVTHLGGATLKQGSTVAQSFSERDRQVFNARWLQSGDLRKLREGCWRDLPTLDRLYSLPEQFATLLEPAALSAPDWKEQIAALVTSIGAIPALRTTFLAQLKTTMFSSGAVASPVLGANLRWLRSLILNGEDETNELAMVKRKIGGLVERWKAENKRVVVYPAGAHTSVLFRDTSLLQANIVGLGDSNRLLEGEEIWGRLVVSPATLMQLQPEVVLISSKPFENEIWNMLKPMLPADVELVRLYADS
jgi:hypothetical protein